ncbi:MAG: hypothetical protein ACJ71U_15575 [Terriglobales bacterium]
MTHAQLADSLWLGLLMLGFLFWPKEAPGQDNGIAVGAPKVFDNRSLELMLEQFEQSLHAATFVDKGQLAGALGQFQGSQQTDLFRDLELTANLTPQIPGPSAPAAPKAQTSDKSTTASTAGMTTDKSPKPPGADSGSSSLPDAVTKKYGIAAEDILDEQVNLTYQIFNLRMLLQRSLTDRDHNGKPRLQAVLGFEVSLNPLKQYKDHAAVVEVRVLPIDSTSPVSLVGMMPREKTYNVAALTTKVNQFGGAAVTKVMTLGYTERHRGQTVYLVKDTDTFAFERNEKPPTGAKTATPLIFGWTFRPVLNRRAVEAGTRQVFAIIALPTDDAFDSQTKDYKVSVHVKTYWVSFDRKTSTSEKPDQKKALNDLSAQDVPLFTAQELQKNLSGRVTRLDWSEVGEEGALINVFGDRFYTGTTAIIGGAVLDQPVNGLFLRSDHQIQALTTLRALARSDGVINGRYGTPRDLIDPKVEEWKKEDGWGFTYAAPTWIPNPDRTTVTLEIRMHGSKPNVPPKLFSKKPIIIVGKQLFPPSRIAISLSCREKNARGDLVDSPCLKFTIDVPAETLNSETPLEISVPFLGADYHVFTAVYAPFRAAKASLLREGDQMVYGISGTQFKDGIKILADQEYGIGPNLKKIDNSLLELTLDKGKVTGLRQFVLVSPDGRSIVVPVPTGKPDAPKPFIAGATPRVELDSSLGIDYKGKDLNAVKKVTFEGDELKFEAGKGGDSITIFVTRKVTAKAGTVELVGVTDDGTLVRAKLQINGAAATVKQ